MTHHFEQARSHTLRERAGRRQPPPAPASATSRTFQPAARPGARNAAAFCAYWRGPISAPGTPVPDAAAAAAAAAASRGDRTIPYGHTPFRSLGAFLAGLVASALGSGLFGAGERRRAGGGVSASVSPIRATDVERNFKSSLRLEQGPPATWRVEVSCDTGAAAFAVPGADASREVDELRHVREYLIHAQPLHQRAAHAGYVADGRNNGVVPIHIAPHAAHRATATAAAGGETRPSMGNLLSASRRHSCRWGQGEVEHLCGAGHQTPIYLRVICFTAPDCGY